MPKESLGNFNGFEIFHYKTIDSTQKEIWRRFKNGTIKDKTMIIADIQTAGIGTHGRIWHTDEENNIAFSIYFDFSKKNCKVEELDGLTVRIAKRIVRVFKEMYDIDLDIKFPNDIYCNGRKLGGILTETKVQNGLVKCVVIGIGINTNQVKFADEIKDVATSVRREFGIEVDNRKVMGPLGSVLFGPISGLKRTDPNGSNEKKEEYLK